MAFDLSSLETERRRTVRLVDVLDGFELDLRYSSMYERERWRRNMKRDGILAKDGAEAWNPGRLPDFVRAHIEQFVVGWRVPERFRDINAKDVNPPFRLEEAAPLLVQLFNASPDSFTVLAQAIMDDAGFLSMNGGGSPSK